jgi:argonaute-like protein/RNase H domain-containing protein/MID domain-containing protein
MTTRNALRLTSLTLTPDAQWNVTCQVAAFPPKWLEAVKAAWGRRGHDKSWSLPTRSLTELLIGLDPTVVHVGWKLDGDRFITCLPGADKEVLAAAVAAWAITAVAPPGEQKVDWWELCQPGDLVFRDEPADLLEYGTRPNGTAAGSPQMFDLLPTFLAQEVMDARMPLAGRPRTWILGPPKSDGVRSVVLWPPERLENPKTGDALVTAKITFHVETVPHDPVPSVHADLSISRFPLMPVTYIPPRGDGPPGATIWLHAPDGFLRKAEPHTLLGAPVDQVRSRETGKRQWQWSPGMATVLGRLTHLPFPNPEKVLTGPATAAEEGSIRAFVLYSTGSKSAAGDVDDLASLMDAGDAEPTGKARTLLHAANTGFVPGDHIEAHARLADLLGPRGLRMHEPCSPLSAPPRRRPRPARVPGQSYTIELWTQSDVTREAVLAALEHHHGLTPSPSAGEQGTIDFTGDISLRLLVKDAGALAAGIDRPEGNEQPQSTLLGRHARDVEQHLQPSPGPRAAILELGDDRHFARIRKIDPKPALKKGFARTDRRLQCLQPAALFTPPATPPKDGAKAPEPYPGTRFAASTILRASAAINDALRQLGCLGAYETPEGLPDLEQIGIWLHHAGNTCLPIVIRLGADGSAVAYLAADRGASVQPLSYSDLPKALATGKGRITSSPRQKAHVANFLVNALGTGDSGSRETHDRVVFVRSASFRNWGWDWLQDKNIQADRLVLPGVEISDDKPDPPALSPQECPGLRIIRVRERGQIDEVPRGFGADYPHEPKGKARVSGVFAFRGRVSYAVNPRADQMQTPLGRTKLDPDVLRNYTAQVSNPAPLEVYPVFLQPGDDHEAYAHLASSLRRMYLHTEQATLFPAALHLGKLADEYI